MSRVYGFLGGVLTTLSVSYLTAQEFHSNANRIKQSLQGSKAIIDNMHAPAAPPTMKLEYEARDSVVETVKDIWNAEVTRAVNWLYSIDRKHSRE